MHVMQTSSQSSVADIDRLEDIHEVFMRRASRKEFPTVKFIVYLQYAALLGRDAKLLDSLIRYGFDDLYDKLKWLDKIVALEIACSLKPDYVSKLLDKVACEILYAEYQDLGMALNTANCAQAMGIFHQMKYSRQELWNKCEQLLTNLY